MALGSFLSLCIFSRYECNVMAVSGAVCTFHKGVALETLVKSVSAAFIAKYFCKIK